MSRPEKATVAEREAGRPTSPSPETDAQDTLLGDREYEEGSVMGGELEHFHRVVAIGPVVAVSEHDALGVARGA